MLKRRTFIAGLGAAAASPLVARAQQPATPVIGYLSSASRDSDIILRLPPFRQGLEESGYVEGHNVAIEYLWAEERYDRLSALAAELVQRRVTVITAFGAPLAASAAKAATRTIPIVFAIGVDPVEAGLVASLNRPGGNLTGIHYVSTVLGPKRLEVLHELAPMATVVAVLVNPSNPNAEPQVRELQEAARTLGLQLHVLSASTERDLDAAFERLVQVRAGALVVGADGFFNDRREQLAALAIRHSMPTIYQDREFAAAGGLASYGGNLADGLRLAGTYVGRIFKGERPAELPVQQSTQVELVINLKTAKALGITVPITLLGRADEVIE